MENNPEVVEQVNGYTRVYSLSNGTLIDHKKEQIIDLRNKNRSSAFC